MGYPLGKAPTQVGTAPWPEEMPLMEGTSPQDMRRIIGAQYLNNGIIPNGGVKVTGTSSMAYAVSPGAVFLFDSVSSKLGRLIPVEAVTVNTSPAPTTGTRTDTLYVDPDGIVRVHEGVGAPTGVEIARFVVPAGITATRAAQQSHNQFYAVPAGASLGRLAWYQVPLDTLGSAGQTVMFSDTVSVPTDRLLRVDLTATIKSVDQPGAVRLSVEFLGGSRRTLLAHHTPEWNTFSASWSFTATKDLYTFRFVTEPYYDAPLWKFALSHEYVTEVTVWDAGAWQ